MIVPRLTNFFFRKISTNKDTFSPMHKESDIIVCVLIKTFDWNIKTLTRLPIAPFNSKGNGYLSEDEMRTVLKSCMEESKLKFDDQQINELMEVFFDEIERNDKGEIGLEQFKAFLSEYPGVAENLSIR